MRIVTALLYILMLLPALAAAQGSAEIWTAFQNEEEALTGFKDKEGKVMIPPRFMGVTVATRFRNIIGAMEEKNGTYPTYYLLKNGRQIGTDSLYIFDFSADCECEGFIRFRDKKTDKVGFFDSLGRVAVPALYSDADAFHNGMAMVLQGAVRTCWEGGLYSKEHPCEHWSWKGGQSKLIGESGQILVDSFPYTNEIDWYSMQMEQQPSADSIRDSYKGCNGKYYTFINSERHFKKWLLDTFAVNMNQDRQARYLFPSLTCWDNVTEDWVCWDSRSFAVTNDQLLQRIIRSLKAPGAVFSIMQDSGGLPFEDDEFDDYRNDCGEPLTERYPVFNVVIDLKAKDNAYQDHITFLKTKEGYRLISITAR